MSKLYFQRVNKRYQIWKTYLIKSLPPTVDFGLCQFVWFVAYNYNATSDKLIFDRMGSTTDEFSVKVHGPFTSKNMTKLNKSY